MIITNFKTLIKTPLRKKALQIVEAGYEAINIEKAVKNKIKLSGNNLSISDAMTRHSINLNDYKKIFIIGIGKGSALASAALAKILGSKLSKGIVIDIEKPKLEIKNSKLEIFKGTHPISSTQNIKATKKIIELAENTCEDDLIISFICGGGSALLCGSEKEAKNSREIFKKLTGAGANIIEINTIRKHLSEVKGGGLAKIAYPATVFSLIVSDVFKNDLSMVASGPTIYDKTAKKDAEKILVNYKLRTTNYELLETPKDRKYFKKVKNILFISNHEPVKAMMKKAEKLGFSPKIYSYNLKGEAKNVFIPLTKKVKNKGVIIAGGETTIVLGNNPGKGGRNMEAVLGAITRSQNPISSNLVVISFASDGRDNTDAAGAIGDILTIKKAKKFKLDFEKHLKSHSTWEFFKKTDDLIFAEKKNFNVSDLMLVIKE
ncbi:MAG: DUF4147 domain-containing protein [Candidatus Paceibacterota bacterium]